MTRLKFSSKFLFDFCGFHLKSKKNIMDSRIVNLLILSNLISVCHAENITDDPHEDPQIDCGEGILIPGLKSIFYSDPFKKLNRFTTEKKEFFFVTTVYPFESNAVKKC